MLHDLRTPSPPGALDRAASPLGAAILGVFGFAVPTIFGMFPRLAPGLLGLPRLSALAAALPSAAGAGLCASALTWAATGEPSALAALGALAAGGGTLLLLAIGTAWRRAQRELKVAATLRFGALSRPGNIMLAAGLLYLIAGSLLFAAVAGLPGFGPALSASSSVAWPLHLLTAGFIALTVFGVGTRMFGAFSGADAPPWSVWLIAAAGIPAPAGIAFGLARSDYGVVALSGALGVVASATFAAVVAFLWARHRRRRRYAWLLLMAGSLLLLVGEGLGVLFAVAPTTIVLAPVHGQINVLGFAGLSIFGVLFELSGGRAARPRALSPGTFIAFVWPAALALRAAGVWWGQDGVSAVADAALLAGLLAAVRDAHPSGPHPLPAKRTP